MAHGQATLQASVAAVVVREARRPPVLPMRLRSRGAPSRRCLGSAAPTSVEAVLRMLVFLQAAEVRFVQPNQPLEQVGVIGEALRASWPTAARGRPWICAAPAGRSETRARPAPASGSPPPTACSTGTTGGRNCCAATSGPLPGSSGWRTRRPIASPPIPRPSSNRPGRRPSSRCASLTHLTSTATGTDGEQLFVVSDSFATGSTHAP